MVCFSFVKQLFTYSNIDLGVEYFCIFKIDDLLFDGQIMKKLLKKHQLDKAHLSLKDIPMIAS